MPPHELYRAAVDPLRAMRLVRDGEFVSIEFVSADKPRPLFTLPGIAATPDHVRAAARVVGGLVRRMRTVLQGADAVKALATEFPGLKVDELSLRQDHNGFRAMLLLTMPGGAHHRITVGEENTAAFGDVREHRSMLEVMRRDVFPTLAAQHRKFNPERAVTVSSPTWLQRLAQHGKRRAKSALDGLFSLPSRARWSVSIQQPHRWSSGRLVADDTSAPRMIFEVLADSGGQTYRVGRDLHDALLPMLELDIGPDGEAKLMRVDAIRTYPNNRLVIVSVETLSEAIDFRGRSVSQAWEMTVEAARRLLSMNPLGTATESGR